MKRFIKKLLLAVLMISLFSCAKKNNNVVFNTDNLNIEEGIYIRDDKREDSNMNIRYVAKDNYTLKAQPKYGIENIEGVDTTGLDTLYVSASGQFDEKQFKEIAEEIKRLAGDRKVYIVDLRNESHGFLNGRPCSWYKFHNTANEFKKYEEILEDEISKLNAMKNRDVIMYTIDSDEFTNESEYFQVTDVKTEKDLVESEGFNYLRYTCIDHRWPNDNKVEAFIELLKNTDLDNVWFHFHCNAGVGRTGVYMALYDMYKNKNVALEDIVKRQCMLGAKNLLQGGKEGSWKKEYADETKEKIKYYYDYIHK